MLNLLASRFADFSPVIVNAGQAKALEANLEALSASADAEKLLDLDAMATAANAGFWLSSEDYMSRYRPYTVKDGILIIPVRGVLLHDFPWATPWATGYEYIWQAYKRGVGDLDVKGIATVSHSPGGEVAGCFEACDKMFALRDVKPTRAFAHEYAYSAAYATVSANSTEIVVSKTGGVGSIGVVTSHMNMKGMLDQIGIEITFITFGKHKVDGNPYEALSPDAKERIQTRINQLGEVFVAQVARNRGLAASEVRKTEALTYSGSEAMEIGLADRVGPLDEEMATFMADLSTNEGDEQMSDAAAANAAAVEAARKEGFDAGKKEGLSEGTALGSKNERGRILAILESEEGKKRPKASLSFALKSDMSADAASAILADLAEENAAAPVKQDDAKADNGNKQNFNAAMEDGKPKVGDNAAKDDQEADADSADGVLDIAATAGIPGLRQRKKA